MPPCQVLRNHLWIQSVSDPKSARWSFDNVKGLDPPALCEGGPLYITHDDSKLRLTATPLGLIMQVPSFIRNEAEMFYFVKKSTADAIMNSPPH